MSAPGPIRVLIADDSPLFRELIARLVSADAAFRVVGIAGNGDEAAALAVSQRPDVITMDLHMPEADGFEGIAQVMARTPTPILVLSGDGEEAAAFRAFALGALDLLEKPQPSADLAGFGLLLRQRLRLLSQVKVIRHVRGSRLPKKLPEPRVGSRAELVVIGASLGGPKALASIVHALPGSFPAPVVVVQHIAHGFTAGLAAWLDQESELTVREAKDGERLVPGRVLLAPGGTHLLVGDGMVGLFPGPDVDGFRPSVTRLFSSAAQCYGARVCAAILTGMGNDGAAGVRAVRDAGGQTIAQDEASCAVFGMPKAAIDTGAVIRVLPLEDIPRALLEVVA